MKWLPVPRRAVYAAWAISLVGTFSCRDHSLEPLPTAPSPHPASTGSLLPVRGLSTATYDDIGNFGQNPSFTPIIGDNGDVTGRMATPLGVRGVRWSPTGGLQDLHLPPGCVDHVNPLDINGSGTIVGTAHDCDGGGNQVDLAFRWDQGSGFTLLSRPASPCAFRSGAQAINDAGVIAGTVVVSPCLWALAVWYPNGTMVTHPAGYNGYTVVDINEAGQVAGYAMDPGGTSETAFLWDPAGAFVALPKLAGAAAMRPSDINENGTVVGRAQFAGSSYSSAWRWTTTGGMQDLGLPTSPSTGSSGHAIGVTDAEEVIGWWLDIAGIERGFSWTPAFGMEDIGAPSGATFVAVRAVNKTGIATGELRVNGEQHAFRWTKATGFEDLGTGLGSAAIGYSINSQGQVAGMVWVSTADQVRWARWGTTTQPPPNACVAPPAGLVGWWPGEDSPGDVAGSSDGTLLNGATYTTGKVGRAFLIDGVDDGVLIGQHAALDAGPGAGLTIAAWIYPTGDGSSDVFGSGPVFEYFDGVFLWQEPGSSGLWGNLTDVNGIEHGFAGSGVAQNAWNHLALSFDRQSGVGTIYLNGNVVGQGLFGQITPQTSTALHLGMRPPGSYTLPGSFNGRIDEVQIYNRALPASEVQSIVQADASGLCTPATNTPPVANAGGPYWGTRGHPVTLDASSSGDADGDPIASYEWSFGDGFAVTTTAPTISHTYAELGVYLVTLTVRDPAGASSSSQSTVTVEPPVPTITAGERYVCALRASGTAACWGWGGYGATGVPANVTFTQLVGGFATTCGLRTDRTIGCWGSDGSGQNLSPSGSFDEVSMGQYHGCALGPDGTLDCWGLNAGGAKDLPPGRYAQVSAGWRSTCAIKPDGTLVCVGILNGGGNLTPGGTFLQVSTAEHHACAIRADRAVVCWGGNGAGEVGGAPFSGSMTYVHAGTYREVRAAIGHTCAVRGDGTLTCWGYNADGRASAPSGTFEQVAVGSVHSCALRTTGTITCWGSNADGQLNVPAEFLIQQAIAFTSVPPTGAAHGGAYAMSATGGSSGNPVIFSSLTAAVCNVSGSIATFIGVGSCTVAANQAGNLSHAPAPEVTQSFTIAQASQMVNFTSTPPDPAVLGQSYSMSAIASSGLPVTFAGTDGICVVAGRTAFFVGVGRCRLSAIQQGNANYLPDSVLLEFPVIYQFTGFTAPISNAPEVNTVKAGSTVKIRFALNGNHGLNVVSEASVGLVTGNCSTATLPSVLTAASAGAALKYDATDDQYTYTWQTDRSWSGTCQQFVLRLNDGTTHQANFFFRK